MIILKLRTLLQTGLLCFDLLPPRTDSETTDDQCLPESISEVCNDSAIDSTGEEQDGLAEELPSSPSIPTNTSSEAGGPPPSLPPGSPKGPPMICLEVRDSSTESDKTVLSMASVLEQHTRDSLPGTPGSTRHACTQECIN